MKVLLLMIATSIWSNEVLLIEQQEFTTLKACEDARVVVDKLRKNHNGIRISSECLVVE